MLYSALCLVMQTPVLVVYAHMSPSESPLIYSRPAVYDFGNVDKDLARERRMLGVLRGH